MTRSLATSLRPAFGDGGRDASVVAHATLIPRSILPFVPVLVAGPDHLRAARLDGRAGFILSLIDGVTTVEGLLDLGGMPTEETLGIIKDLRARGIVMLRKGLEES